MDVRTLSSSSCDVGPMSVATAVMRSLLSKVSRPEIQKLATWANGEQITRAAVEELAVGRAETPIFAVTDAWGRRDVAATLRATESLLDRSHRPRSGELIRIVASMVGHVGRVRKGSGYAG